ncbi:MAG: type II secretion system minor pseudopilin GspK [Henriciella sp.]|nr:type II secretion system minor pseudopilin GspK [Henriciella sp.]
MSRAPASRPDRGAALVTVLMIVAAMSSVALALTQAVSSATQRARALDGQSQLRFYAVAAEEAVKSQIDATRDQIEGKLVAGMSGLDEVQTQAVEGGLIAYIVSDASNCFDLNALVLDDERDELRPNVEAMADYTRLLERLQLPSGDPSALTSSLVDWMDDDQLAGQGGAEDSFYLGLTPSYRTSGLMLNDISELRAIRHYDAETVAELRDLVCTRPANLDGATNVLNINTLKEEEAPLLVDVVSGAIEVEDAVQLIASRPQGGWSTVEDFLTEPLINSIAPELIRAERLDVVSRFVEVSAELTYREQMMRIELLFDVRLGQPITTLRRERVG